MTSRKYYHCTVSKQRIKNSKESFVGSLLKHSFSVAQKKLRLG